MDRQSLWWEFYGVQETLNGWGNNLISWAVWLEGLYWPLPHLAPLLRQVAQYPIYAKYKIWLVYNAIIWVLDSIPNIPSWEAIRDWLRGQWPDLNSILQDATDWIGRRIPRAYGTSTYIHHSFYYWLSDWLFRDFRWLYNFYRDPVGTIRDIIRVYMGSLWEIETTWWTWLDARIPKAYPWSPGILVSFKGWGDDWLRREWFDLWYLKTDFPQWFKTQLASHLPDIYDLLYSTSEELEAILLVRFGSAMDALRHPGDYLRDTWFNNYPESAALLAAPATYIWCKLKEYLDGFVEAEVTWIQKIAARVLNALW